MDDPLAIVLAAGMGTRMKSELPKVLFPVGSRPMIHYVLDALEAGGVPRMVVVVGYRSDLVRQALAGRENVEFVEQAERRGTGHAVLMCRPRLEQHDGPVVVVAGDSPLLQPESVSRLLEAFRASRPACLLGTLHKPQPLGLGRIVRDGQGQFLGIVEEKDASAAQRQIAEVNMSTYVFDCHSLLQALDQLRPNNQQRELYLTDCPGILRSAGQPVEALAVLQPCEALSINTLDELAAVEQQMQRMGYF